MPLDPHLRAVREQRARDGVRPLYGMSLAEARAADLASIKADRGEAEPVGEVTDLRVPGADGDLDARLYRPPGTGPFPVVVYFFGGGWTLGNLETSDGICRRLCAGAGCVVVSVAYRLAPEHKFPAAPHDCHAATRWVAANAPALGADPDRVAVAGDSAGGNLAAAVTLLARTGGPALTCQVLVYPNVDYGADTPSMRENTDPYFFNSRSVAWYWGHYLADPRDGADPLASPLRAEDLGALPPALVVTAELDPLRDEGEAYAQRLRQAGVPVELVRYDGMTHGFFTMTGTLEASRTATARVVDYLGVAFGAKPGGAAGHVDRVPVRFEGDGSGVEELSWGQLTLLEAMDRQGTWMPIGATVPLPPGTTVEQVADRLRFWMGRYQTMRTRLRFDPDGWPRQVVSSAGETWLEVVDAADIDDPAKVAEQVEQRLRETDYDFASEWPVRMAVVRHRGVLTHQVLIMCHLVTDAAGAQVMLADLAGRDPLTGEAATPTDRMQPMAQARWQRSPAGQRTSEAAIRHMDRLARTMPPRRFGSSRDPRRPRYWEVGFVSPATYLATRAIMSRNRTESGMVLLTAFLLAVARVTGTNPAVTHVLVNNRFRSELAGVVGPHLQGALLVVDVGGITFDEALARTRRRAMAAYKHAYYDPYRKTYIRWAHQPEGMELRIGRERGEEIEIGSFLNDRRLQTLQGGGSTGDGATPTPAQLHAALPRTTLRCERQQEQPLETLLVNINDVPDTVDITAQTDTHHISPSDLEALLRTMEAVAVEAAFDGTAPTGVPAG